VRAFKTKGFQRWANKSGISDSALRGAVTQMERGLVGADLGGYLFKQRITLPGRGKSGSARTVIATKFSGMLFFLYGFEKNERDNITARELGLYQRLAHELLNMTESQIASALGAQFLTEVKHESTDQ
jgi:hypothetical protein